MSVGERGGTTARVAAHVKSLHRAFFSGFGPSRVLKDVIHTSLTYTPTRVVSFTLIRPTKVGVDYK